MSSTPPLVSSAWLADRLLDPQIVILDATLPMVGVHPPADTHARYLAQHLPGALFFDIDRLSDQATTLPHMLPSPETFARDLSALGVGSESAIVVYEQGAVFSAPRAWWMLQTMGAREVYLLGGGLPAWMEAGLPVVSGLVTRPPAVFHASLDPDRVKTLEWVQQWLSGSAPACQVLDARSAARFTGRAPEPRPGIPSGHIPGSLSVPFTELTEGSRLKPVEALRRIFVEHGVDLAAPLTTTCGSGVTAAVVALALELCGANRVSLYDGSWAEYAQQPGAAIALDA